MDGPHRSIGGGVDRRSLSGIPGGFGIVGDSYVKFFLPNTDSGWCPAGGPGTHRENTA